MSLSLVGRFPQLVRPVRLDFSNLSLVIGRTLILTIAVV